MKINLKPLKWKQEAATDVIWVATCPILNEEFEFYGDAFENKNGDIKYTYRSEHPEVEDFNLTFDEMTSAYEGYREEKIAEAIAIARRYERKKIK